MARVRNPFLLRAADRVEPELFVRLFCPEVLDLLPEDAQLWTMPLIVRSVAGAGKSSLLRIFSPEALRIAYRLRAQPGYDSLFAKLMTLGAVDEEGPVALAIASSCAGTYSGLELLDVDEGRRLRLFASLLNSRLLIAAARAATALSGRRFPEQASEIKIEGGAEVLGLSPQATAADLLALGQATEEEISGLIDTLAPIRNISIPAADQLSALQFLAQTRFYADGKLLARRCTVMIDDVHELTPTQRRWLIEHVMSARLRLGTWIAERLQALRTDELLAPGAQAARDFSRVIELDHYWRDKGRTAFERFVREIANKRVQSDPQLSGLTDFFGLLADLSEVGPDRPQWAYISRSARESAEAEYSSNLLFKNWLDLAKSKTGSDREVAQNWQTFAIAAERQRRRRQSTFDFALPSSEFETASAVDAASELFLARKFDVPYYYGAERLADVASGSVEQFLRIASALYEEISAAVLLKKSPALPATRQHKLIRLTAAQAWETLPQRVPDGYSVRQFLKAVGEFCQARTYLPNAPYAPGVTGIAISMRDRDRLRDPELLNQRQSYAKLARVLGTCIAYHLLEPKEAHRNKGQEWFRLDLNRLLCVYFGLPLQRSGWKEQKLERLVDWMERGPKPRDLIGAVDA
jgi:hypothetical protein